MGKKNPRSSTNNSNCEKSRPGPNLNSSDACPRYLQVWQRSDYRWLRKRGDTVFSIICQCELSVAIVTTLLIRSVPKPKAAFPPPQPKGASDKIWLKLANQSWRYFRSKVWTTKDDGRRRRRTTEPCYTISSPCETSSPVSCKELIYVDILKGCVDKFGSLSSFASFLRFREAGRIRTSDVSFCQTMFCSGLKKGAKFAAWQIQSLSYCTLRSIFFDILSDKGLNPKAYGSHSYGLLRRL